MVPSLAGVVLLEIGGLGKILFMPLLARSAAFYLDTHPNVVAFAKNSGLGFAIPYFHNRQMHDFVPDYLVRLEQNGNEAGTLILEVKGYDERAEVKKAAAKRWCAAVNADKQCGKWDFCMARNPAETNGAVSDAVQAFTGSQ
jgi:type III restriction enzyme